DPGGSGKAARGGDRCGGPAVQLIQCLIILPHRLSGPGSGVGTRPPDLTLPIDSVLAVAVLAVLAVAVLAVVPVAVLAVPAILLFGNRPEHREIDGRPDLVLRLDRAVEELAQERAADARHKPDHDGEA